MTLEHGISPQNLLSSEANECSRTKRLHENACVTDVYKLLCIKAEERKEPGIVMSEQDKMTSFHINYATSLTCGIMHIKTLCRHTIEETVFERFDVMPSGCKS